MFVSLFFRLSLPQNTDTDKQRSITKVGRDVPVFRLGNPELFSIGDKDDNLNSKIEQNTNAVS